MESLLADVGIWSVPCGRILLTVHLLIAVFAIGVVTHHWWLLLKPNVPAPRLASYAKWMAIGYPLSWLAGVLIYPSYNVLVRKPPIGVLEKLHPWAVGLFEIKEHLGSIALVMIPWLAERLRF